MLNRTQYFIYCLLFVLFFIFHYEELMFSTPPFDRPWDFSIQDTSEEVRLIFHMWIGLFYSRSTPRSFHFDSISNIKEREPLNILTNVGQVPTQSFAPSLNVPGPLGALNGNALDLSKKDGFALDLGGDVLDLSQRNAQAKLDIEPQAKQRQTSWFGGQRESGYGTLIALKSTTVAQKVGSDCATLHLLNYLWCALQTAFLTCQYNVLII